MPHLWESEGVKGVGQHAGVMAVKQGKASMCSLEDQHHSSVDVGECKGLASMRKTWGSGVEQ